MFALDVQFFFFFLIIQTQIEKLYGRIFLIFIYISAHIRTINPSAGAGGSVRPPTERR